MSLKEQNARYMCTVTVGAKGQIVIPKAARDMFDINPGDELLLLADTKRGIAIPSPEDAAIIRDRVFSDDITAKEAPAREHD